jgi:hypothetical protein
MWSVGRAGRSEGAPRSGREPKPEAPWMAPLLRSARAPPCRRASWLSGGRSRLWHDARPRSPSRPTPRRVGRRGNRGAFLPPGTLGVRPLVVSAVALDRPPVTRPLGSRGGVAIGRRAPLAPSRAPASDEASTRNGSPNDRAGACASCLAVRRSAPVGIYDRFRSRSTCSRCFPCGPLRAISARAPGSPPTG